MNKCIYIYIYMDKQWVLKQKGLNFTQHLISKTFYESIKRRKKSKKIKNKIQTAKQMSEGIKTKLTWNFTPIGHQY